MVLICCFSKRRKLKMENSWVFCRLLFLVVAVDYFGYLMGLL